MPINFEGWDWDELAMSKLILAFILLDIRNNCTNDRLL